MKELRISPLAQIIILLVILTGVGAVFVLQLPELKRYLKIRSM